jgi:phospholipid/cholesterol/gamma-HCH transport system substrate-binding protein
VRRFLRLFPPAAFKFGIFALVCAVLLVGLAVRIGNISLFSSRHTVNAELTDVTGLAGGDKVNVAGVTVGQVTSIALQRGHAVIGMSINNTVPLRETTDVGMRWHNVIGQKEIELYPGKTGALLASGATLPLTHDVSDASIDTFLNSLGPLLSSINATEANAFVENVSGALEGDTAEINQLLNSGAAVSSTVQALDSQVGQIIGNLNQVLTALASRSGDIDSLVSNLQTVSSALASKNSLLDGVVGNLSQVATDLANLIGNNHNTITNTINNLQAVAADVQNNKQNLANSLSSLGAGLAPYIQISQWGQWFAVETIYTCLAGQTICPYYQPGNPPPGSGPLGSPPLPSPLQNLTLPGLPNPDAPATAGKGASTKPTSATGNSGAGSLAASSLGLDLQAVSGAGAGSTTTTTAPSTPSTSSSGVGK